MGGVALELSFETRALRDTLSIQHRMVKLINEDATNSLMSILSDMQAATSISAMPNPPCEERELDSEAPHLIWYIDSVFNLITQPILVKKNEVCNQDWKKAYRLKIIGIEKEGTVIT